MVTGFEKYTHELTDIELNVVLQWILNGWKKRKPGEVLTRRQMVDGVNRLAIERKLIKPYKREPINKKFYVLTGPRFRKIIHHIRVADMIPNYQLIANSKGYFLSNNQQEIDKFIKSCRERANSFNEVANAMKFNSNYER